MLPLILILAQLQCALVCISPAPLVAAPTGLPALPAAVIQPALPAAFIDTTYPIVTGAVIPVHAGGNLQAAFNAANCGDNLVLDAGASWTGNFHVPATACTAGAQILVSSSAMASLPGNGSRIQQSQAGLTPTLITPNTNQALEFAAGAAYWYFVGIGVTIAPGVSGNYDAVVLGAGATSIRQLPAHIVFDRVLVRGNGLPSTRGFFADAAGFALINSQVWGFVNAYRDTQALIACNTPGPFLIVNNYLEATGENIMFGGCDAPPPAGMVPSDIIVVRNNLNKQASWHHAPAPCNGPGEPQCYDVKNNFECKSCQRVLVDSNIMNYAFAQGQGECAIVNIFSGFSANDVTFSSNLCQHAGEGFALNGYSATATQRVMWRNNLLWDISPTWGSGRCYSIAGPSSNLTIDHNTCINHGAAAFIGDSPPSSNVEFSYTNNIAAGPLAANGDNPLMVVQDFSADSNVSYDVFVGDVWPQGCVGCNPQGAPYPTANHLWEATSSATPVGAKAPCNYPAGRSAACVELNWEQVRFIDYTGGAAGIDLRGLALAPASPYHNAAGDGTDIGANIANVLAAVAGVQQGCFSVPSLFSAADTSSPYMPAGAGTLPMGSDLQLYSAEFCRGLLHTRPLIRESWP